MAKELLTALVLPPVLILGTAFIGRTLQMAVLWWGLWLGFFAGVDPETGKAYSQIELQRNALTALAILAVSIPIVGFLLYIIVDLWV